MEPFVTGMAVPRVLLDMRRMQVGMHGHLPAPAAAAPFEPASGLRDPAAPETAASPGAIPSFLLMPDRKGSPSAGRLLLPRTPDGWLP